MTAVSENNKRIARNTLYLYFRMILVILVSLYTTRVVLAELGVSDYGIYNVVGGFVTMLTFLNSSMSASSMRFITYELGRGNPERLRDVFCASVNVHACLALVIVILGETVGLWFVNSKLNIAPEMMPQANWVYQFSILTSVTTILQVPYNSVIIAHEKMSIFAVISILEVLIKLGIALLLIVIPNGKLVCYAGMFFASQLIVRIIYQIYCRRNFAECRYRMVRDTKLYKSMTGFASWSLLGSMSWIGKNQGVDVLINIFFGTTLNAAIGVVNQIRSALFNFVLNFMQATNPQITKYYANHQYEQMQNLTMNSLKYCFFMVLLFGTPLALNGSFILNVWLEEVPPYTSIFLILVVVELLSNSLFDQPLMTSIAATGNVKRMYIWTSAAMLLILPVCYVFLKLGARPPVVFIITSVFLVIAGLIRFQCCHVQVGYSWGRFWKMTIGPGLSVLFLSLPIPVIYTLLMPTRTWGGLIVNGLLCVLCVGGAAWLVGLKASERLIVQSFISKKLKR